MNAISCTCGGRSVVLETRERHEEVRRRRECTSCGDRWTTYERRDGASGTPGDDKIMALARKLIEAVHAEREAPQ